MSDNMDYLKSPEYLNANASGPVLKAIIAFMVLQTFFVFLHVVARLLKKSTDGPETWFILAGYLFNIAFDVTAILEIALGGTGRHAFAILVLFPQKLFTSLKILVPLNYTYLFAVVLPKLAVLCIYLRIFKMYYCSKIIYLTGLVLIANLIAFVLAITFVCRPFAYNWDKSIAGGHCGNQILAYEVSGFPNIVTDVIILGMPIPFIWKLQASRARKIGLTITFWTGSLGTVSAAMRTYNFYQSGMFKDLTYNSVRPLAWSVTEGAAYQMAATFLTLGPLFRDVRQKTLSFRFRSSTRMSEGNESDVGGETVTTHVVDGRRSNATVKHGRVHSLFLDSVDKSMSSTVDEVKSDLTLVETYPIDWPLVTTPSESSVRGHEQV